MEQTLRTVVGLEVAEEAEQERRAEASATRGVCRKGLADHPQRPVLYSGTRAYAPFPGRRREVKSAVVPRKFPSSWDPLFLHLLSGLS